MTAYLATGQASQDDWLTGLLEPDMPRVASAGHSEPAPAPFASAAATSRAAVAPAEAAFPLHSTHPAATSAQAMFASPSGAAAATGFMFPGSPAVAPVRQESFAFSVSMSHRHFLLPFALGAVTMFCGEFVLHKIFAGPVARPAESASSSTSVTQRAAAEHKLQPPANPPTNGQNQANLPGQAPPQAQPSSSGTQQPTQPAQTTQPTQPPASGGSTNVYDFLFGAGQPGKAQPPAPH